MDYNIHIDSKPNGEIPAMISITADGMMKLESADKTVWLDSNSNSFELSVGNSLLRFTIMVIGDYKEMTLKSGYKTIFKFNAGEF